MKQPQCAFVLKKWIIAKIRIKNTPRKGSWTIIYAEPECTRPKTNGSDHILTNAERSNRIR